MSGNFGIEAEQRLLDFDHVTLGGKAAQYWNLPVAIQEAIEQHETAPGPDTDKSLGLLVYTANLLTIKTEQSDALILEEHAPFMPRLPYSMFQSTRPHDVLTTDSKILTLS